MVQQILSKLAELNPWAADMDNMLSVYDPSLRPFLEQIAKSTVELARAIQEKASSSGILYGSPVVPPTPPANPAAPPPQIPTGM